MKLEDFDEFCKIVIGFAELRGKTLSAAAQKIYFRTMMDRWTLKEFQAAAEQLLRTCDFMPTPKNFEDLRRTANRPSANEAWAYVLECCRRSQRTSGSAFLDRVVASIGGWETIAHADVQSDLPFLHTKFLKAHDELLDAAETREHAPQLTNNEARSALAQLGIDVQQTTKLLR